MAARRGDVAALEREHAEVLERDAAVRIDGKDALEDPARLVAASTARQCDAERVERIGVGVRILRERLEHLDRFARLARLGQVLAELRHDAGLGYAGGDRALQRLQRGGNVASLPLDECEVAIRDRHVGTPRDDALVDLHRIGDSPRAERFHRGMNRGVEVD